jgi:hypothetical protein
MAATLYGPVSDMYKGRICTSYDQLDYDNGDLVVYPDLIQTNWTFYQPQGSSVFSGSGSTTTGAASKLQFIVPSTQTTDPHSWRVYFTCTVSGTNTSLCNYVHSVFQQLTIQFTGASNGIVEQVQSYNVFCSMLYKFWSTNHVRKIHSNLEGYTPLPETYNGPANTETAVTGPFPDAVSVFTAALGRVWNGNSFMIPMNVGFFMSARKLIPNFILPTIRVEFIMESVARATMSNVSGSATSTPNYSITNCQLIINQYEVLPEYIDDLRRKVVEREEAGDPIRLDMASWTFFPYNLNSGTGGNPRINVTKDLAGLRKLMFAQVPVAAGSSATTNTFGDSDAINTFTLQGLSGYRWIIGGHYYPDQVVNMNNPSAISSGTGFGADSAFAYFLNAYAMGVNDNPGADMIQSWAQGSQLVASCQDMVMLTPTEFDDAGMPSMHKMVRTGQVDLLLYFAYNTPAAVQGYIFANVHRMVTITDGCRASIIEG